MLTRFDDYLIHQTIDTLDHVATGDPRFMDRGLFNVHGKSGEFLFQIGFGVYPNQNMIDAWSCAVHGDLQCNLRVARPLRHDRSDLNIGPLQLEVVEPMSVWKIRIDENAYGVQCDLTFRARTPAFEFRPTFIRRNNLVEHHQMHVMQSGTFDGWVRIGDHRIEGAMIGSRDRSWGVRGAHVNQQIDMKHHGPVTGGETTAKAKGPDRNRRAWIAAEFDDYTLHGWFWTDSDGKMLFADGAVIDVASGESRPRFSGWSEPVLAHGSKGFPETVEMRFVDEKGGADALVARPLLSRCADGNGYFKGFYGRQRPALHVEGESWNMADPAFRQERGYMNGAMLAEFVHQGNVGYGVLITTMLERFA